MASLCAKVIYMQGIAAAALNFFRGFVDIVFPKGEVCDFCGSEIGDCSCRSEIRLIEPNPCRRCGRHNNDIDIHGFCVQCRGKTVSYDANFSAAYYDGAVRRAILDIKYNGALYQRQYLGRLLYEKYRFERRKMQDIDAVTYVPISFTRQMSRGYNQAREIAEVFSTLSGIPLIHALSRKRSTRKLSRLGKSDRKAEIANSMFVKENYLTTIDKNTILIIDDIFTTGATIDEAAKRLKAAGASAVYSLTVAGK